MIKRPFSIFLLYLVFAVSGRLYPLGEKTILLGGELSWDSAVVRKDIDEASRLRPNPVLVLASGNNAGGEPRVNSVVSAGASLALDLALSFDEGNSWLFRDGAGHYSVSASPAMKIVDRQWARAGGGAAFFPGVQADGSAEPLIIEAKNQNALFAPDNHIRDFTLEFWLYPLNFENGEVIMTWTSSCPSLGQDTGKYAVQQIQCFASKNRLNWSFLNFFVSPDSSKFLDISFSGDSPVVPRTWSHHLVRFDADTGLIEYVVDGQLQAVKYAVLSGHEGGEVYTPLIGKGGSFSLGSNFSGFMDEFRVFGSCLNQMSLHKYPRAGRIETLPIDLGEGSNEIISVQARGGRTSMLAVNGSNEFQENGRFRFTDDSEMQFFIRMSENPYNWSNSQWRTFTPGDGLPVNIRGRYVQLAVDFYPSADGLCSPYLEDIRINYMPDEPPMPPSALTAVAGDRGVTLRWKNSPDMDVIGYLVYYGTVKDDFFGEDAIMGVSPIDAGKQTSLYIEGLKNGVLYYFRVAAYNSRNSGYHAGEFSREVSARPLEGL